MRWELYFRYYGSNKHQRRKVRHRFGRQCQDSFDCSTGYARREARISDCGLNRGRTIRCLLVANLRFIESRLPAFWCLVRFVTLAYSVILYEGLGNAVYTVTNEYVEEQGGVILKSQHRIALSYVRDVTYHQSFLQAMFGVASVTVTPTNGNKMVISNIAVGEEIRERIWDLVLSNSRALSS